MIMQGLFTLQSTFSFCAFYRHPAVCFWCWFSLETPYPNYLIWSWKHPSPTTQFTGFKDDKQDCLLAEWMNIYSSIRRSAMTICLFFFFIPIHRIMLSGNGNMLMKRRWLNPEKKECPAPESHTNTYRLSLLSSPLLSHYTLPLIFLYFYNSLFERAK